MIYRHPDGTFHRFAPHAAPPKLEPINGRPGWWRDPRTGAEKYIEPEPTPVVPIFGCGLSPAVLRAAAAVASWYRKPTSEDPVGDATRGA